MHAPQVIAIVLFSAGVIDASYNHGKLVESPFNRYSVNRALFRTAVWAGLLYWGGFWSQ